MCYLALCKEPGLGLKGHMAVSIDCGPLKGFGADVVQA